MADKDVEMIDASDSKDKKDTKDPKDSKEAPKEVAKTPEEIEALLFADMESYAQLIDKTALTKEMRHLHRALRHTFARLRRKLTVNLLTKFILKYCPTGPLKTTLLQLLKIDNLEADKMEVVPAATDKPEEAKAATAGTASSAPPTSITPELEVYIRLLVAVYLIDNKHINEALTAVDSLVDRLGNWNRRTMDPLSAKVYFYYSRAYELANKLSSIRVKLLQLQRTATLRHNYEGQVILLNLLMRNYLHYNLYDQAIKLSSKADFKADKAATNELARYHYYLGRVQAVQLSYSDAYNNLQQALRKGPRDAARGFRALVTKFLVIVQLLLGEIPERSIFRSKGLKQALKPYLELTQTVRSGDVIQFKKCVSDHEEKFKKDNTHSLIHRLHHNVIKTGLRKINSSYSRIHFEDICKKLNLETVQDAEFIVAKAIHDKIIDAQINHAERYIKSNDNVDIYSTNEPEKAFRQRIDFCHQIHNDAVKAMRYPPDFKKKQEETPEKVKDDAAAEIVDVLEEDDDDAV